MQLHDQTTKKLIIMNFWSFTELTYYIHPLQSVVVMCRERIESIIQEALSENKNNMTNSMGCRWSFVTKKKEQRSRVPGMSIERFPHNLPRQSHQSSNASFQTVQISTDPFFPHWVWQNIQPTLVKMTRFRSYIQHWTLVRMPTLLP